MKAILLDTPTLADSSALPGITLLPDSAITPPGRPVFLPDFGQEWVAEIYLCGRISRLGKEIALKFAPRYFDSLTVALRLLPADIHRLLTEESRPAGVAAIFDNALTLGSWQPAESFAGINEMIVNGQTVEITDPGQIMARAVVAVSRYATLKTGDLLMPLRLVAPIPVNVGSEISVTANGCPLIALKIK